VLVSTCAKLPRGDGGQRLLGFVPAPFRGAVFLWAVRRALLAPTASSAAIELTLDEIRRCPGVTIQCDTALGRTMDMTAIAQRLRVPTLVLCGARDRLTPPELSRALAGLIAGSRLLIVPGAGHMLPLEAPEAVDDAIRGFVAAVTDGARPAAPPPARRWRRILTELAAVLSRRRRGNGDPARAPVSPPPAS
jgi:pimeloyl-ACP methyl ester carboxylesterase